MRCTYRLSGRVRIISGVDHNHWNGWDRTSSMDGSQSLELGVSITGIHRMRANEDSGRSPIPSWRDDSEVHYVRWMGERGSPSGLSDLEIEVAKAIAAEWDAVAQKHPFSPEIYFYSMGNWLSPSRDYQLLKLLHVCSVLKLQGYGAMREHVLRCISESIPDERLSTMIHLHIPAHRDRPFRLNVTACSGLS